MKDPIYAAQATEIAALCAENAELSRKLEILKEHGIEIVDAVAGGFEIYSEDYARASELKAENAKLRELANIGKLTAEHCTEMEGTVVALKAENDKLRELVCGLYWCNDKSWNKGACDDCSIRGKALGRCERVMRELGIEVD